MKRVEEVLAPSRNWNSELREVCSVLKSSRWREVGLDRVLDVAEGQGVDQGVVEADLFGADAGALTFGVCRRAVPAGRRGAWPAAWPGRATAGRYQSFSFWAALTLRFFFSICFFSFWLRNCIMALYFCFCRSASAWLSCCWFCSWRLLLLLDLFQGQLEVFLGRDVVGMRAAGSACSFPGPWEIAPGENRRCPGCSAGRRRRFPAWPGRRGRTRRAASLYFFNW